ncbi:MAG: rane protein [Glaciihabitans sp.]|nr:rane protein [Glaciihabitans sp.]
MSHDSGIAARPGVARRQASASTLVHHRRRPHWYSRLLPIFRGIAITLVVVLASGASVASAFVWQIGETVTSNAVDISNGVVEDIPVSPPTIGAFEGGFNILAVGADNDPEQAEAFGDREGTLNDVNIVVHVSADHLSATVLSLPRDLVIPQPRCVDPDSGTVYGAVSAQPLNAAFGRGGLGCVKATIEEITGLSIPYAAVFTFEGTVAMSDAVGGVPICLNTAIFDPYSGLDLPAGTSVVSGQQALAYLRSRHGVGDGGDLSRISSQQAYMSSLMRVMKSNQTLTDVSKLAKLATAAAEHVNLSTSLADLNTMVSMAISLKDVDLENLTFVTYPVLENPNDVNKLIPAPRLAETLMEKIQNDEKFTLDSSALGNGLEIDPAVPVETPVTETPVVPDPAATDPALTDPVLTDPALTAESEVLSGVRGVTADQQTCSVAYDY